MNQQRLDALLNAFSHRHMLVVGDFFLDEYLIVDRELAECSLETGLEAHQVVEIRHSPGAAGNVVSNVRALGAAVTTLGVIGQDGRGHDLRRGLISRGANTAALIERADRFTPTYTKPIVRETDGREHEIERIDIKNRSPLPPDVETAIIESLRDLVPGVDGVIVADQVQEPNCGVITDRVRQEIGALALRYPDVVFAADSRTRIGQYEHIIIKPNAYEALSAVYPGQTGEVTLALARECGAALYERTQKPVFLTVGAQGILVFTETGCTHVPAVPVSGEIDIVGAGDSTMAAIVAGLCGGADLEEAACLGNLVASITIQQIGTTGTATPQQIRAQFRQLC